MQFCGLRHMITWLPKMRLWSAYAMNRQLYVCLNDWYKVGIWTVNNCNLLQGKEVKFVRTTLIGGQEPLVWHIAQDSPPEMSRERTLINGESRSVCVVIICLVHNNINILTNWVTEVLHTEEYETRRRKKQSKNIFKYEKEKWFKQLPREKQYDSF